MRPHAPKGKVYRDIPHAFKVTLVRLHKKFGGGRAATRQFVRKTLTFVRSLVDDNPWTFLELLGIKNWTPVPPGQHVSSKVYPKAGPDTYPGTKEFIARVPSAVHPRTHVAGCGPVTDQDARVARTGVRVAPSRIEVNLVNTGLPNLPTWGDPLDVILDDTGGVPEARLTYGEDILTSLWPLGVAEALQADPLHTQKELEKLLPTIATSLSKEGLAVQAAQDDLDAVCRRISGIKIDQSIAYMDYEFAYMTAHEVAHGRGYVQVPAPQPPYSIDDPLTLNLAQLEAKLQTAEADREVARNRLTKAVKSLDKLKTQTDKASIQAKQPRQKKERKSKAKPTKGQK